MGNRIKKIKKKVDEAGADKILFLSIPSNGLRLCTGACEPGCYYGCAGGCKSGCESQAKGTLQKKQIKRGGSARS